MTCPNCFGEFEGNYCSQCGQKAFAGRHTLRELITDTLYTLFNLEQGFLFTVKELTLRPGPVIRAYINGRLKVYYPPLRYLLLLATLSALLIVGTGLVEKMADTGLDSGKPKMLAQAIQLIKQYFESIKIILVPIMAFCTYWVFRKSRYYYVEHLIFNAYLQAQLILVSIVLAPFRYYFHGFIPYSIVLTLVISLLYYSWAGVYFFREKPVVVGVKILVVFILGYLSLIAVLGCLLALYLFTVKTKG